MVVEPGTMLYDVDAQMIGWVVGKHDWKDFPVIDIDWDIQWSNGKQEYWDEDSLQYYINAYIMLEEQKNP